MENIISAIPTREAGNNFTTLIAPSSAHASAQVLTFRIFESDLHVPGTVIGSATRSSAASHRRREYHPHKNINAFTAYMQALTGSHNRNATATALMVTRGVSILVRRPAHAMPATGVINQALNAGSTQQALSIMQAGDARSTMPEHVDISLLSSAIRILTAYYS